MKNLIKKKINLATPILFLLLCISIFRSPVFAEEITYEYDELNRLIRVDYPNGYSRFFEFDETGNRVVAKIAVPRTITVSSGANGNISPSTSVVANGCDTTYTIAADYGYEISNVLVDSYSQGAISNYTFTNVTTNHTISATFIQSTTSITTTPFSGIYCDGSALTVSYSISGMFNSGNVFTAQLSNQYGSFSSPTNIGSVTTIYAGSINCTVPVSVSYGTGYRIRVVSSSPAINGSDNGFDLTINNCICNRYLNNITILNNSNHYIYRAGNRITAANSTYFIVTGNGSTGGEATFVAGNSVKLRPGFHASKGSKFKAFIDNNPCNIYIAPREMTPYDEIVKDSIILQETTLLLYPNPTSGISELRIESNNNEEVLEIQIVNLLGELICCPLQISDKDYILNLNNHPSGLYIIQIVTSEKVYIIKLVKEW